jgi:D-alanyl-D-alanine endopeptidase (penicillin-binding protein 7)
MILFDLVGDQFGPLGWSFYHFLWQGMLVAAFYSAACLLCGDNARRRYTLASLFLVVTIVLPAWQIWMILVRHHGLALGIGPPEPLLTWMTLAALLWFCVAAALSASALIRAVALKRQWLAGAVEDLRWREIVQPVAAQLGLNSAPRMVRSATADVMAVIGWRSPTIVIPEEMPRDLNDRQLRALLAHELAHVTRYDPLLNLVLSLLESFVFFHPAAAWLAGEVRRVREYRCDDIAVQVSGDAIAYARGLTALARMPGLRTRTTLSANGGDLKTRVLRLVAKRNLADAFLSDARRFTFWLAGATAVVVICKMVCQLM